MISSHPALPSSTDISFFSSKSASSAASSSSSPPVVVTTRVIRKLPPPRRRTSRTPPSLSSFPPSSSPPSTTASSPLSTPPTPPRATLSSATPSSPPDHALPLPLPLPRQVKRLRTNSAVSKPRKKRKSSAVPSRPRTQAPSPEPIYRSSRSRSTSSFPSWETDLPFIKRRWAIDEDGTPGDSRISSENVVKRLIKSYKAYFKNPADPTDKSFEPHPENYPVVELEYPNTNAIERFILLVPKDKDHYNPILDLEKSLYTMVEYYLTPAQQNLFGPIPNELLSEAVSPPPSPSPSPPNSRASSTSTSSLSSLASSSSSLTSLSSTSDSHSSSSPVPILKILHMAIVRQDGPLFLRAMTDINAILHSLKYPDPPLDPFAPSPTNMMKATVETWTEAGIPHKVLMRIIEENYQRSTGPNVPSLKQYEAFSSTVYGELLPSLSHEIISITKLKEDSLFVDLGSGVGNVVVQASLQTGCKSYGIELMPAPARVAKDMIEQIKIRARMWGVRVGDMEVEQGNMLTSPRVDELIPKADVLLVDNKVFEESLNEALRPKFLDLKEGAIVVSLKPFVNSLNARVTERNVDDISAIFDVTERPYYSGSVSWGNSGGNYYIHRVDREGYAKIRERFENARATLTRTRGRR